MSIIETGVLFLYDLGFFTTLLPFILLYAILFGLFERTNIFRNSEYHAILSFCFAFLAIYNVALIENMTLLFARIGLLFILIIALFILTGLLEVHKALSGTLTILLIGAYITYVVIDIFFSFDLIFSFIPVETILPVLVALIVFGSILWFIFSGTTTQKESQEKKEKELAPERKETFKPTSENEEDSFNPESPFSFDKRRKIRPEDLFKNS